MKLTQKQGIIIFGVILVILIIVAALYFGARPSTQSQKVTLTAWGTDPKGVFDDLATAYKNTAGVNLTLNYTQIDPAVYDSKLLDAFAAGTGPDIFEIGNRDLPKWLSVLAPVPATLTQTFNLTSLQNDFPTVIDQDFVAGGSAASGGSSGQIYALPLDLDTLVMLYNKNLFDTAGIVYPPKTWDDFEADVTRLRVVNAQGQLVQAAAALGGSETSIANASDLVFLLMLQNGTQMVSSDDSSAVFNSATGVAAFDFYLQFANAASPYYTWNDGMGDATQSFIAGNTAIIFGYASDVAQVRQKAPFLNFGIAPMPQPASSTVAVNYAKYNGLVVARQSAQTTAAWQFILFASGNTAGEAIYTKDTGEPPASRAYIAANLNDPNYGVFAAQALTARSWYESDATQIDGIMNTTIQNVLSGSIDSTRALSTAADSVTTVMQGQ